MSFVLDTDIAVIGAGPAGLSAALAAAQAGAQVVVLDEYAEPGGQFYKQLPAEFKVPDRSRLEQDYTKGDALLARVRAASVTLSTETLVWGSFAPGVLSVVRRGEAGTVRSRKVIVASGAYERPAVFPGWDLPGVMTPGGAQTLVKNQQQYAAAWKEIDGARRQAKELEEAELKVMADVEGAQQQIEDGSGSFDQLKEQYEQAHEAWQHSLVDLRTEIEKLRVKIEAIEQSVPESLKREFHKIFKQRQGIAVTRVINESCGACRVHIRPAVSQQLKRGEMVFCEGCRRLLYGEKVAP